MTGTDDELSSEDEGDECIRSAPVIVVLAAEFFGHETLTDSDRRSPPLSLPFRCRRQSLRASPPKMRQGYVQRLTVPQQMPRR